ncbi:MAG: aminotransferase class I/II-fold pyridoxal phosphate-dependent enzyme [Lentisphaerae bacterium]|jgi:aminotransferase|nr:aminotransferase class I/II-fold pyridoxal phosphate-dependent enzyme [Lentisphaerota bacterium]MBT4816890.1 aminotransferase class I/II-fold pyridoxal phosphate-dependent enzyme [Lentisphaerota bacterium]MBT5606835.1 aminotransferase class I/II-fold pyridoxal phosphate-dependent enzyme [Lentisphaerota bacterium]MBT7055307.1 aminotransferase class I/II-fold pyridoxal phosphate-dependent enzyme [Lentisphaerota bacterium]MBT7843088.1 aminotransferase class I/II-fold pyridoxal phosphate-depende
MSDSRSPHSWVASHIGALPRSGIRDFFELVNTMEDVVSLGIGEPDFATPWTIREATIYAVDKGHTSYTSNLGLLSLRKAVCEYVAGTFGMDYAPENQCIITVGVSEALDLILRAVLNPGDEVLIHRPCYVSYEPCITMAHATAVGVDTVEETGFALTAEALAARITPKTKALLLNFPNNPTGADLTWEQKEAVAAVAIENDLLVISDEIYTELTYTDASPSIASVSGMAARTILLAGLSKAYAMTGYRVAYACGPEDLIEAMMKIHQYTMLCASSIAQEAAVEALKKGRRDMLDMKREYEQRRNVIVRRLNAMGLPCVLPKGAFYVFPRISDTGLSSQEFAQRLLQEKRVAVVPGTAFGACGEGYVRCSYATAFEEIEVAMGRIGEFLQTVD